MMHPTKGVFYGWHHVSENVMCQFTFEAIDFVDESLSEFESDEDDDLDELDERDDGICTPHHFVI
jgi:hypothetical protein